MFSTRVLDQHAALVEHGDLLGDHADELHVVLDDDERLGAVDLAHEFGGLVDLLMRHAGGRLVEQDQLGIGRRARCRARPIAAGRARAGRPGARPRPVRPTRSSISSTTRVGSLAGMDAAAASQMFSRTRQAVEHARHLGLDADAEPRDLVGVGAGHVLAAEQDVALGRLQLPGQHLEEGALAGAVRADQAAQFAFGQR